jgi:hypothetical protein
MEITNEIKITVFAQYLGQRWRWKGNSVVKLYLTDINTIGNPEYKDNEMLLELKPLTAITDEHAIEMAKLFGDVDGEIIINRPTDVTNKDIYFVVQVYTNKPKFTSYSTPKIWSDGYGVNAYQWLQSKGYDLPHYLLGGKTLIESGLAICKK